MVRTYEEALRLLVSKADDADSLYAYLTGPNSGVSTTDYEAATYKTYRKVRRIAARALHEFHPEIAVIQ
jgi:hypothetical protein